MQNRRNYYRILQIQPDAPQAVIQASYRALMRELGLHPDLGGDHWNAAILNEAYEILGDPKKRTAYDRKLYERYTKNPFDAEKEAMISYFCPFCKRPLARKARPHEMCRSCRSPLDGSADHRDLRAIERVKKSGQIRFYRDWPLKPAIGDIINVSPQGMRFWCREKLVSNATIKISSRELKAVATVCNTHKIFDKGQIVYAVGVQFLSVKFSEPKGGFCSASA